MKYRVLFDAVHILGCLMQLIVLFDAVSCGMQYPKLLDAVPVAV